MMNDEDKTGRAEKKKKNLAPWCLGGKIFEEKKSRKNFRGICVNQCNLWPLLLRVASRSSRLLLNFCFAAFRGLAGIFYFFVDKSVDIYYNISMNNGNDFLMRFFEAYRPGDFPQGKIKKESREIGKNQWPVKKIDALQKKKVFSKKGSCFSKKEAVLQKRKLFFKKGSCFPKKEAVFQKRKPFSKKGSRFPKKEAVFQKRKPFFKKGSCFPKKEAVFQKRKLFCKKNRCTACISQYEAGKMHKAKIKRQGGHKWQEQTKPLKITFTGKA